jgi:hypothetical protein
MSHSYNEKKTVIYASVVAHVMDSALDDVRAWANRHGVTVEDVAEIVAPILAHLFDHSYDLGTGQIEGPNEQETEEGLEVLRELAEKNGGGLRAKQVNSLKDLEDMLAKVEADPDALCRELGVC